VENIWTTRAFVTLWWNCINVIPGMSYAGETILVSDCRSVKVC